MNKIPSELNTYLSSIQKVEFRNSTIIFYTDKGVFLYLPVSCDETIYSYLDKIDFNNYCELIRTDSNYSLYKIFSVAPVRGIVLLTDLYNKSSVFKNFSLNQKNQIMNGFRKQNNNLMNYYHNLQDRIEEMYYPMNSFYQLLINMSQIYKLLFLGNHFMNKWVEKGDYSYSEVLVLKNIDSNNFIDDRIIDFSKAERDYYVFELANYYQKEYLSKTVIDDISYFEKHYSMSTEDKYLFYGLISNIWEVNGEIIEEVNNINKYVKITLSYLSEKYEEDQKQEEEMLEE